MSDWQDNILREPIARNTGAVLSLPIDGQHKHYKTRFLAEDVDGIWIEAPPSSEKMLVAALIASGAPVAVAFKSTTTKFTFGSAVRGERDAFAISDGSEVAALLLSFPAEIRSVQLRAHLRIGLPVDHELAHRIWKMPEVATIRDNPLLADELKSNILDLSLGGLGLLCSPLESGPPVVAERQRLRILLAYRECSVLLEGSTVHPQMDTNGSIITSGVQFSKDSQAGVGNESKMTKLKAIAVALHRTHYPASVTEDGKVAI